MLRPSIVHHSAASTTPPPTTSSKTAMQQLETGLAVGMEQVVTLFFKEQSLSMFPAQSPFSHNLQVRP